MYFSLLFPAHLVMGKPDMGKGVGEGTPTDSLSSGSCLP